MSDTATIHSDLLVLTRSLAHSEDLHSALFSVLETAIQVSGMDSGGIYLRDPSTKCLHLECYQGIGERFVQKAARFDADSFQERVVRRGQAWYLTSGERGTLPPDMIRALEDEGLEEISTIPILFREQVVGCINLASHSQASMHAKDREAVENLAAHVGGLIGRLHAEEALRQNEEVYRSTIEAMTDAVILVDRNLRVLLCNNTFRAHLDQEGGALEPVGKTLLELSPEMPQRIRDEYEQVFSSGQTIHGEYEASPRGKTVFFETTKIPIKDASNQVSRVVTIVRDVTSQRRAALAHRESTRMESIGRLAGGLAHTINNLLTVITAHSEFARKASAKHPAVAKELAEVTKATQRAEELIQQLLAFSRRQILEPKTIRLKEVLLTFDGLIRPLVPEYIELVTLPGTGIWPVKADSAQIEQVLLHLSLNALEAMPRGGKLTLKLENVAVDSETFSDNSRLKSGPYVCITVSDTGVGMVEEVRNNLFEPFFTTKDQGEGNGLSLSMVYGTIKQHNGTITVESEVDRGTTFRVYLPRHLKASKRAYRPTPIRATARSNETILVVEDEPQVRRVMVRILEWLGYDVLAAGNGEEALNVLSTTSTQINLLLTDVVMPRMGGVELAERLTKERPGTPVLFVSGYPKGTLTRDGELEPQAAFLKKPFDPSSLAHKVREVLDSQLVDC